MSQSNGTHKKYRLVTRSDMDGLVCAMLLRELEMIDDIKFVHPKDVQDGKVELGESDITTNLPYVPTVHLAFDHHYSETLRIGEARPNHIIDPDAPSTARLIYTYYGGKARFSAISEGMLHAVDKADAANFTRDEVRFPEGWVLLSFIMDPRTGLGHHRHFRVSNYQLMMDLIRYCRDHTIDEILELPDVKERVDLYLANEEKFKDQLQRCTTLHGNLAVVDLRYEEESYVGNRFVLYALYPQCNVSMHILWGKQKQNIVFAVGKSIFNRTSKVNIGELMLHYGGGGHAAAGTCQIEIPDAPHVKRALVEALMD
jgi:nanoRNase/pAp phosphatase (c-di-AMP/oligoRNAs hydrolase)